MYKKDTIYGLGTVYGRSGVAIIRISGADAHKALGALGVTKSVPDRIATCCKIYDTKHNHALPLDECLILKFSSPNSFTAEDVIELHLHGSISVINDTLQVLSCIDDFRVACPGEFSKRAFYNEKLDLTKAEGLAMLIDSETSKQREVALRQLSGELEDIYERWRKVLIHSIANIEALIDFPEEDIPQGVLAEIQSSIAGLATEIKSHLDTTHKGISIMEGIQIPIIGPPNAGKSSLLNKLAGADIAITSDIAGTTRDVISVKTDIGGYCAILKDTAGIRDAQDSIEQEGVNRALSELKVADIAIILLEKNNLDIDTLKLVDKDCVLIINKVDDADADNSQIEMQLESVVDKKNIKNMVYISAKTGNNVGKVIDTLRERISNRFSTAEALVTKLRYKEGLEHCCNILLSFDSGKMLDLVAQDLRDAASYIAEITGKVDIEEIIDKIFSTFCIGK